MKRLTLYITENRRIISTRIRDCTFTNIEVLGILDLLKGAVRARTEHDTKFLLTPKRAAKKPAKKGAKKKGGKK